MFSKRFNEQSEEVQKHIVEIGEIVYFNGLRWAYDEKNKNELQSQLHQHETECSILIQQVEDMRMLTKEQVERQVTLVTEGKNEIIYRLSDEANIQRERIKELEAQNSLALQVSEKIESLMGKGNKLDNSTKGDFGENIIAKQIQHWYPKSELVDVSSETASGDLHWKYEKVSCLVEVKNVLTVKANEIKKFERDVRLNKKSGNINCALFVSMKTETIPNKGIISYEQIDNVPVIYLSNVFSDVHNIRLVLDFLTTISETIQKIDEKDGEDLETQQITYCIQNILEKAYKMSKSVNSMKLSIDSMEMAVAQQERLLKETIANITDLVSNVSFLGYVDIHGEETKVSASSKNELKNQVIGSMKKFKEMNNRFPSISELTDFKPSIFRGELSLRNLKAELEA